MAKLSLSDIKARSTGHFFSKASMDFFKASNWPGATTTTKYAAKFVNGNNYVVVTDPWGKKHYHLFVESTGELKPVDEPIEKIIEV